MVGIFLLHPIMNSDIWWHLKAGEYIINEQTIPNQDIFSFAIEGKEWIDLSWLFQKGVYTLYSYFGLNSLIIFKTILGLVIFYLLLQAGYYRENYFVSLLVLIIVLFSSSFRFMVRPEVVSYFYCSLYLFLLHRFKYHSKTKIILLLPVIQILWVNSHGLFIIGVIILTSFWLSETIILMRVAKYFDAAMTLSKKTYVLLTIITFSVILVNLINPYGLKGVFFLRELYYNISGSSDIFQNIIEFQPLLNSGRDYSFLWSFYALLSIVVFSFIINFKKINLFRLFLFVIFIFLAIKAIRNVALFSLVSGYIAIANINLYFSQKKDSRIFRIFSSNTTMYYMMVVLLFCMMILPSGSILQRYLNEKEDSYGYGFGIKRNTIPIRAMKFIRKADIKENMFNFSLGIGNYFIWEFWPQRKVFSDGRLEVYDEEFFYAYLNSIANEDAWNNIIEKYNVNYLILDHTRANKMASDYFKRRYKSFLNNRVKNDLWKLVYIDPLCVIFIKNVSQNSDIIKRYFIDVLHKDEENDDLVFYERDNFIEKEYLTLSHFFSYIQCFHLAHNILKQGLAKYNDSIILRYELANVYIELGKEEAAEDILKNIISLKGNFASAYATLGRIYFDNNMHKESLLFFKKAEWHGLRSSQLDFYIAEANRKTGDIQNAIRYYKKTIRKDPRFLYAYNNLGSLYAELGEFDKAEQFWKKTLKIDPNNIEARENLQRLIENL